LRPVVVAVVVVIVVVVVVVLRCECVGAADCPHYAKVELLAEQLANNLQEFKLRKIVKLPNEWNVSYTH